MSSESSNHSASETKPFLSSSDEEGSVDLEDSKRNTRHLLFPRNAYILFLQLLASFVLALLLAFVVGRQWIPPTHSPEGLLLPVGTHTEVWYHNYTFSQAPTPESEAAWDSIVPVGRGFIHHETLAPFVSNIAVFHQLHCLHAILVGYYTAQTQYEDVVLNGTDPAEVHVPTYGAEINTKHIRHCFDYLRRYIQCSVATDLEILDPENFTTTGWGDVKTCRNYEEVVAFAETWKNSSDLGIVA